jgi:hypothetical protein
MAGVVAQIQNKAVDEGSEECLQTIRGETMVD